MDVGFVQVERFIRKRLRETSTISNHARWSSFPPAPWSDCSRKDDPLHDPDDLTVIQFDDSIPEMKIPIVMGDDRHTLASGAQFWKQLCVENLFVLGILVRRPLIEHIERSVFEVCRQQGQPSAVDLGTDPSSRDAAP